MHNIKYSTIINLMNINDAPNMWSEQWTVIPGQIFSLGFLWEM